MDVWRGGVADASYYCKGATCCGGVLVCPRATAAMPRHRDGALGRCAHATMPAVDVRRRGELSTFSRGRVGV